MKRNKIQPKFSLLIWRILQRYVMLIASFMERANLVRHIFFILVSFPSWCFDSSRLFFKYYVNVIRVKTIEFKTVNKNLLEIYILGYVIDIDTYTLIVSVNLSKKDRKKAIIVLYLKKKYICFHNQLVAVYRRGAKRYSSKKNYKNSKSDLVTPYTYHIMSKNTEHNKVNTVHK